MCQPLKASSAKTAFAIVRNEFKQVDRIIQAQMCSDVPMVHDIGQYIINSGGKRLRPLLVLLSAGALGRLLPQHIELAAIIEFLHTATLLHDDVVDHSELRRGRLTANAHWSNAPSVLVGDFLYARAFEMMVKLDSMAVMALLSEATRLIAEGEVMQLMRSCDLALTEADYELIIQRKTAMLFRASSASAAALSGCDAKRTELMALFGQQLGMAFQIIDDVLDLTVHADGLGKCAGDDLAEGKMTLPIILALKRANSIDHQGLMAALQAKDVQMLPAVCQWLHKYDALQDSRSHAQQYIDQALQYLQKLPSSDYQLALVKLTEMAVARVS